ncbi:phospholipase A1 VesT1.02-like [Armigeres subalbatus]|uniref:phospholipase A1 VesT1.02-like n=1 Tax=Armigeres subalbatus TaxID=124917 RepID=UPI002ED00CA6
MSRNLSHCTELCNANHSHPHCHRSCTFFTRQRRATHVCRRLTLTGKLPAMVTVLGVLLAGLGPATMAPAGDESLSITKRFNGEYSDYDYKLDANPYESAFYKYNPAEKNKSGRQDAILEYFPVRPQVLDEDELLVNRLNMVAGAVGNTLSQILFGTNELRSEVTFWCANRDHAHYMQVTVNDPEVHYKVDVSKPLMMLAHGWTDNVNRSWVKDTVADYIGNIGGNVCAVDWSRLALVEYNLAAKSTPKVGRYLAKFVKFLLKQGLTMDQVTLVGHSMGAHIVGIAGQSLDGTVPMIIGLDPAGPAFTKPYLVSENKRLDKSDGMFVQAIHTDKDIIGTTMNVGHQDFFTNSGASPQPGCEFPLVNNDITKSYLQFICSHFKAVEYFRASLHKGNIFEGTNCNTYNNYKRGECTNNARADFGLFNNKLTLGPLYITIDKTVYPYAKSIARGNR